MTEPTKEEIEWAKNRFREFSKMGMRGSYTLIRALETAENKVIELQKKLDEYYTTAATHYMKNLEGEVCDLTAELEAAEAKIKMLEADNFAPSRLTREEWQKQEQDRFNEDAGRES